ncbi:hypothetical protein BaRGS_00038315 [Batillaria attramentaria]|uniref:Uncharacterized protein n=1 Tax=Batillaria attramentaria TaxID=370345 RepID=A0ABD0J667_9CAEN
MAAPSGVRHGSSHKTSDFSSVDDSSDSDGETEPAKNFFRRISTNKGIKTSICYRKVMTARHLVKPELIVHKTGWAAKVRKQTHGYDEKTGDRNTGCLEVEHMRWLFEWFQGFELKNALDSHRKKPKKVSEPLGTASVALAVADHQYMQNRPAVPAGRLGVGKAQTQNPVTFPPHPAIIGKGLPATKQGWSNLLLNN